MAMGDPFAANKQGGSEGLWCSSEIGKSETSAPESIKKYCRVSPSKMYNNFVFELGAVVEEFVAALAPFMSLNGS